MIIKRRDCQESKNPDGEADTKPRKTTTNSLSELHREAVSRAISNIFLTDIAESTYSQIVDGLPLANKVNDVWGGSLLWEDHPVFTHIALRDGVQNMVKSFRTDFDPQILEFDASLLQALQVASPGSRAFNTRLIEVIAVAVHQVAVLLYKNNADLWPSAVTSSVKDVHTWVPPKDPDSPWSDWWEDHPDGPPPTLFHHSWYMAFEQYPDGAADMVGYWAESRILGGVVLFDRTTPESDTIYLHPDREDVTYRICQLTDTQKVTLLRFLRADNSSEEGVKCPLPILPDENNTHRVDPEEPFSFTGVYRDIWEREMPPPEHMGDGRASCVWRKVEFPTMADFSSARSRWRSRSDRR